MTDTDNTRAQILAAATAVFAEKGFNKASMNDVVRASGLSKGGVYWHFKSKDDLLAALFTQFFTTLMADMDAILQRPGRADAKLRQFAQMAGADVEALAQQFPSPLEFYALAARDKALTGVMQTYFDQYHAALTGLVQQGIADGAFRDVDAAAAARTLSGLFEGMLLVWAVSLDSFDLSAQVETAVDLILNGLNEPGTRTTLQGKTP